MLILNAVLFTAAVQAAAIIRPIDTDRFTATELVHSLDVIANATHSTADLTSGFTADRNSEEYNHLNTEFDEIIQASELAIGVLQHDSPAEGKKVTYEGYTEQERGPICRSGEYLLETGMELARGLNRSFDSKLMARLRRAVFSVDGLATVTGNSASCAGNYTQKLGDLHTMIVVNESAEDFQTQNGTAAQ
ncbi:hypothetical protein GMORB2_5746 [Geosmithia morbida]|uniref:Uncharacterized protein n=1 Tax=Geosmithia morbida TaxID=1094350 RepID=A0A9P4YXU2_9HYPO|nr:uncharacterized protein GMORB2_5746 [Geosmithia morbida]KAF4124030.1 hypothetical protein GMORB2_5746 [Geosmithia morbida]